MTRQKYLPSFHACGNKINRILIANRAEIASRIIRTCKLLNKDSIAIYLKQDQRASFWQEADEAYYAGDLEIDGNVYLDIHRLIEIARKTGADAIHPGYGYLSENASFAQAVKDGGLTWIGPDPSTIEILGDKARCKQFLAESAPEVPLIPGIKVQNSADLVKHAKKIGFPVLLKASAGGGGKGMRIVNTERDLESAYDMARSEARRSFGSDDMLLEKYIAQGKHIEVQMFGDRYGNVITLGTRECSVQRRHQKVIEEAPAIISHALEMRLIDAAIAIGKATSYIGAGTVEFIVDVTTEEAYFLEVNTRVQVEHPITEEIYGIDIIALQIYVASSGSLLDIDIPSRHGHAIEMRLCAENPYDDFLPQIGRVSLFAESVGARYESSVKTGDVVSINFDPMICKVIVYDDTRDGAIAKARKALMGTVCLGFQTNQTFMLDCLMNKTFLDSTYTTSVIADTPGLLTRKESEHGHVLVSAICRAMRSQGQVSSTMATQSIEVIQTAMGKEFAMQKVSDRKSTLDEYQLESWSVIEQQDLDQSKALNKEGHKLSSRFYHSIRQPRSTHSIVVSNTRMQRVDDYSIVSARISIDRRNEVVVATIHTQDSASIVHLARHGTYIRKSGLVAFGKLDQRSAKGKNQESGSEYRAPMPCKIIRVDIKTGDRVDAGQSILVIESMKTEIRILSRREGNVKLLVKEGDVVGAETLLATVED